MIQSRGVNGWMINHMIRASAILTNCGDINHLLLHLVCVEEGDTIILRSVPSTFRGGIHRLVEIHLDGTWMLEPVDETPPLENVDKA